jgi:hypothetical protein
LRSIEPITYELSSADKATLGELITSCTGPVGGDAARAAGGQEGSMMWQWVKECLQRVLLHMHCIELNRQDVLLYQRRGIFGTGRYPEMRGHDQAYDSIEGRVLLEDYAEPVWSDGEEEPY